LSCPSSSPLFKKCKIIAIELTENSRNIITYIHPERAVYLLGAEDIGISKSILEQCDDIIQLPGNYCLNVSTAGSIVMYDRLTKKK